MTETSSGTFLIDLTPGPAELGGQVQRYEFDKTFAGGIEGTSRGLMLSAGDPASGSAGYVALEIVTGRVGDRAGTFGLQQFGSMTTGAQQLHYTVVPGSGTGELAGLSGELALSIDADGAHSYSFEHRFTA